MMTVDGRSGRFFEDFQFGETIRHATPRSLGEGDAALYIALTGSRFAVTSSAAFARDVGYAAPPLDDLLVFNMVFGKTVPDISLNAVANLGYADCRFLKPVSAGETLSASSEVIGLKENSNRETGVVHVRTTGVPRRRSRRWRSPTCRRGWIPPCSDRPVRKSFPTGGKTRFPGTPGGSRITRPATASTMSMA